MAAVATPYSTMIKARNSFYGYTAGSAATLAAIHFLARDQADADLRLIFVVMFFAAFMTLTWGFAAPLQDHLRTFYAWRYANCDPSVQRTITLYTHRVAQFGKGFAWIGTAAAGLLGLWVLSFWAIGSFLAPIRELLKYGWWLGFACLPIYLVAMAGMLREALRLRASIAEQTALSGFNPRSEQEERAEEQAGPQPPVVITGPLTFRAGGFDWNWGDFYKNAAIFGQSGSGKTLCVLNALLEGLIGSSARAGKPASGLILDPKGDFRDKIAAVCEIYGRRQDLMVIDPTDLGLSVRWNPLDSPDDELELSGRFAAVLETLGQKGEKDTYWIDSAKTFIRHVIALLREAKAETGEPPNFAEIYECATNDARLAQWCEAVGDSAPKSARRAVEYIVFTWETLAGDTKSVVRSYIANMLDPFLMDPYEQLFSGRSSMPVGEMIDRGKLLYVYMPIAEKETMAKVVSTFVKLEFFREILKRPDKDRPSFFLCDEFQAFFTVGAGRGDADAFERTRQSNHASVIAFQNLPSLLKQAPNKEPVDNLLGNCAVKLFLRNTDVRTNEYASGLFGEHLESLVGTGHSSGGGRLGGGGSRSLSTSAQYSARIKKDAFSRLAQPSREDGVDFAEAIVHLSSRGQVTDERLRWKVHPLRPGRLQR